MPVTLVVLLPGVFDLAMPPFFTDLLADFLAEAALALGVAVFFAEEALGVFLPEAALGVFLAEALGVATLADAGAGDSSTFWRLLDFWDEAAAGEAERLDCLGAFLAEAALGVAVLAAGAAGDAALGVADALAGVAALPGVAGCLARICDTRSADLADAFRPSPLAICCRSLRSSAPKLSALCFDILFAVIYIPDNPLRDFRMFLGPPPQMPFAAVAHLTLAARTRSSSSKQQAAKAASSKQRKFEFHGILEG